MKKKYQSELLGAIHETAAGLHKIGVITDAELREYDADCLLPASPSQKNTEADMPAHTRYATASAGLSREVAG
jgi:DNA-binding transcriptional regulator YiaG